jgi:ribonuclease HI
MVLINVDAAIFASSCRMGAGVVIRDHNEIYVAACSDSYQEVTILELAEAMAMRKALIFTKDKSLDHMSLATDCIFMVQRINAGEMDRSICGPVVQDIKHLIATFSAYSVVHVRRELNAAMHLLARSSKFSLSSVWRGVPPDCIRRTLCIDIITCLGINKIADIPTQKKSTVDGRSDGPAGFGVSGELSHEENVPEGSRGPRASATCSRFLVPPRPPMATTLPTSASATNTAARIFQSTTRCRFPRTSPVLAPSRSATRRFSGVACSPGIDGVGGQAAPREDTVRIVAVVGDGSISPLKDTPWEEVMRHTVGVLSEPNTTPQLSLNPHQFAFSRLTFLKHSHGEYNTTLGIEVILLIVCNYWHTV